MATHVLQDQARGGGSVGDCVEQLEGRAKRVIDLTYRENQSRADIAVATDMTESGVKSLLRRTRDVLRQCVERKIAIQNPLANSSWLLPPASRFYLRFEISDLDSNFSTGLVPRQLS